MVKRMLIDATHPEETRVVVVTGNRLEEFDFESASKKQLKGNIYLAKVTRVEPSLQAAFVEYGGNRHGFLAFSEIHPDYYRIPVADREALLAQEGEALRSRMPGGAAENGENGESENGEPEKAPRRGRRRRGKAAGAAAEDGVLEAAEPGDDEPELSAEAEAFGADPRDAEGEAEGENRGSADTALEVLGGDEVEEASTDTAARRPRRNYKIQEVIKRRQIMLVQVTKEERGNKGAALTTYLSLAGRYCVLMPNTPRGGGISRKIANPQDRKRLKAIMDDLYIPDGMAVILRTAGLERTKAEIKRDLDYLIRLWDSIRELTLSSTAPALINEEANLIKRAIRDLYAKDIDEIYVGGEEGYRTAKDFMRMLMPSHAKKVQLYKDGQIPLFHRYQVETQIDAMHSPVVQLRSGGYIVINATEALVAIDVNSGRATRERNIEETAYRTNLEAADEVARQLRLRDLAGLIVIDFIDMEDDRHNTNVERRLKDAMKSDRARIQLGRISPFGLLELSRQRLRPSLVETHFEPCTHCHGTGLVRSLGSTALHILRTLEEEGIRRRAGEITLRAPSHIALYILNHKRDALMEIEGRYGFRVFLEGDDSLVSPNFEMERSRGKVGPEDAPAVDAMRILAESDAAVAEEEAGAEVEADAADEEPTEETAEERTEETAEAAGDGEDRRGRRRRRRGRRRRRDEGEVVTASEPAEAEAAASAQPAPGDDEEALAETGGEQAETRTEEELADDAEQKRRRRGRRGGRRRTSRRREDEAETVAAEGDGEETAQPRLEAIPIEQAPVEEPAAEEAPAPEAEPRPTESAEAMEAADAEGTEAKPTPKRRRTRKPKATEPAAETEAETVEAAPGPAEATPEPEPAEAAPKRRRTRKPKTAEPAAEAAPEPEAARSEEPEPEPAEPRATNGAAQPEPPSQPAQDVEVVNKPPQRPRKGWWQRLLDE